jgi:hypothetical protein
MLPFGAPLLTRMNPFVVKIWIVGCCTLHTSTSGELATIVPRRILPDPVNRRSTRPPTGRDTRVLELGAVELGVKAFVAFAGASAVEAVFEAPVGLPEMVLLEPASELTVGVLVCVDVPDELPPQPASSAATSSAAVAAAANPSKRLCRDKLIENQPSGELIGSTGSWRAPDRVAVAP